MIFRFCLYSFLRKQEYFGAFILLAFLQHGLSYTEIGMLFGFREICINLLEIPSGVIADVLGRRRTMLSSFVCYIVSLVIFGLTSNFWVLFGGMFFFAVGSAFRTGTHKAMIFEWLKLENREDEKTHTYGLTRSWGNIGAAVSVIPSVILLFYVSDFRWIFYLSTLPYFVNFYNIARYPSDLEGVEHRHKNIKTIWCTLLQTIRYCYRRKGLKKILFEGMCYEGLYKATKDYIQAIIKVLSVSLPIFLFMSEHKRTALLIGIIYFGQNMLNSVASRYAQRFCKYFGGEERSCKFIWYLNLFLYLSMFGAFYCKMFILVIAIFICCSFLENIFRPIMVSRCASHSQPNYLATILSIESQSKSLYVALFAPILGYCIDLLKHSSYANLQFLPIAMLGLLTTVIVIVGNQGEKSKSMS